MKYRGKHYKSSSERWGKSIKRAEPFLRLLEIVVMLYSAIAISGYANQLTKVQVEIARADIQPDFSMTRNSIPQLAETKKKVLLWLFKSKIWVGGVKMFLLRCYVV